MAKADEEIHKQVQETTTLARATQACVNVTDWVTIQQEDPILKTMIEWISNQKVQGLKHLLGDDTDTEEGKLSFESREADALPRSPLLSLHSSWQVERSFAVCSLPSSSSSHHEWMSLRCWTPGSGANSVFATRLVLVARNGHADAEGNQPL